MDQRLEIAKRIAGATCVPLARWMIEANDGWADRIIEFCLKSRSMPGPWMLESFQLGAAWIGCRESMAWGDRAICHGRSGCHGFLNGCGCLECQKRQRVFEEQTQLIINCRVVGGHFLAPSWGPVLSDLHRRDMVYQQFLAYIGDHPYLIEPQAAELKSSGAALP